MEGKFLLFLMGLPMCVKPLLLFFGFLMKRVQLMLLAKSMFGEELARQLIGCRAILLLQPSSIAAERVLSLLSNYFKENQQNALEDYI